MVNGVSKQVLEHRHVMSIHLGRPLLATEIVHHKDHDGLNNDIENLEIMTRKAHQHLHMMAEGPKQYPIQEAIRLRTEEGWTIGKIADHFNVGARNILMAFRARGIDTSDQRHGRNIWDVEAAKRLLDSGASMLAIARNAGVSAPSVRKAFVKRGWIEK